MIDKKYDSLKDSKFKMSKTCKDYLNNKGSELGIHRVPVICAIKLGIECTMVLMHIGFYVVHNCRKNRGKCFHGGFYWTFSSVEKLHTVSFPKNRPLKSRISVSSFQQQIYRAFKVQCLMGAVIVVIEHPFFCFFSYFIKRPEHVGIQQFSSDAAIQPFNESILCRLARLDEDQLDPIALAPFIQLVRDKLWPIVHAYHLGQAPISF